MRALIESQPDMVVVAEAADGEQAIEIFHRLRPKLY